MCNGAELQEVSFILEFYPSSHSLICVTLHFVVLILFLQRVSCITNQLPYNWYHPFFSALSGSKLQYFVAKPWHNCSWLWWWIWFLQAVSLENCMHLASTNSWFIFTGSKFEYWLWMLVHSLVFLLNNDVYALKGGKMFKIVGQ